MNTSIFCLAIFIHREPFCLLYLFVKEGYQRPFKGPDFTPSLTIIIIIIILCGLRHYLI